ncbi:PD-(D/E)XK nuclease family protein [bacterium]|nr:PD-(D/E)XK nuclease family protein [bacterium]
MPEILPSLDALPAPAEAVFLCATLRQARRLRSEYDRAQAAKGLARWQPLKCLTVGQWLESLTTEALLAGEIPAADAPRRVLTGAQEAVLWEQSLRARLDGATAENLFDLEGLAAAAAEANELIEVWGVGASAEAGEETRQFLYWRAEFRRRCEAKGWLEPARHLAWQVRCVVRGAGRLPARVVLVGFDRTNPLERRLLAALEARGVGVSELSSLEAASNGACSVAMPDRQAECRAAAAWVRNCLSTRPASRLAIVVPELASLRPVLLRALDDALAPASFRPARAEAPRAYNLSLGEALAAVPLVDVALRLLRLATAPRRVPQTDIGALLCLPYWSADESEMEGRARLDARLRAKQPRVASLERTLRFARAEAERGMPIARLLTHLTDLLHAMPRGGQLPSAWGSVFRAALAAAGWCGERSLSSHEWQARQTFFEVMESLAALDAMLGPVTASAACRRLARLCREKIFQPETKGEPTIEVLGPLEAAGIEADGVWVMGMNEHQWPPVARPNPLLPAAAQRAAEAPGSCAAVQAHFAASIHRRLLAAAPTVVFSWSERDGDRPLRPSPLLVDLPAQSMAMPPAVPEGIGCTELEYRADTQGPALGADESLKGGANLLKAQAVCPAWAFYEYRLGARALECAEEGFDARERGNLVHAVLESFWAGRGRAELRTLLAGGDETLLAAITAAVDQALTALGGGDGEGGPGPRFLALEQERLTRLMIEWLAVEAERGGDFSVAERERSRDVDIEGLRINLRVDRLDRLADGRPVLIDYKTGSAVSTGSWFEPRITEPQLPLYAAFGTAGEAPVALVLAKVRRDECGFKGAAMEDGLLPGLDVVADWEAQVGRWREAITALAREVRAGEAAVRYASEKDLDYCPVKPLLRLPEARLQREGMAWDEGSAA